MRFNKDYVVIALSIIALCGCSACSSSTSDSSVNAETPVTPPPAVTPAIPIPASTPTPGPVVTPTPASAGIQTSVAAATESKGSQGLGFFATLNDFRGQLGLGPLAHSAKLDKSSATHLTYIVGNPDVNTLVLDAGGVPLFQSEDPVRPGVTGVAPTDRATVTLFRAAYVGAEGGFGAAGAALTKLFATVYHRSGLMQLGVRDIGMAFGGAGAQTFVFSNGFEVTLQFPSADYFGSYPADKQTAVPLTKAIESPNSCADVEYAGYATKTSFPINAVSEAS